MYYCRALHTDGLERQQGVWGGQSQDQRRKVDRGGQLLSRREHVGEERRQRATSARGRQQR